jgi:hypothetical protein
MLQSVAVLLTDHLLLLDHYTKIISVAEGCAEGCANTAVVGGARI